MKKILSLVLAALMLLCLCACAPAEAEPTTLPTTAPTTAPTDPSEPSDPTEPSDPADNEPCEHVFTAPDCENPATCTLCGEVGEAALGHNYASGICVICQTYDPNYHELTSDMWYSFQLNEDGSVSLGCIEFQEDGNFMIYSWSKCITYEDYLALGEIEEPGVPEGLQYYYKLIEISGEQYAVLWQQEAIDGGSYTLEGDMLTLEVVTFLEGESLVSIRLERIAGNAFQITESALESWDVLGFYYYPQDGILAWGEVVFALSTPSLPMM